jgi:hypothetical protein
MEVGGDEDAFQELAFGKRTLPGVVSNAPKRVLASPPRFRGPRLSLSEESEAKLFSPSD